MSTSPEPGATGTTSTVITEPVVYSPIPALHTAPAATRPDPAPAAAGYAAGWAQGVAAAAVNERRALAEVAAVAAAEREQLAARTAQALQALAQAAEAMRVRTAPDVDATADSLATAAIDLAEVVLGTEVADAHDRGLAALHRALSGLPEHEQVVVRLNPGDLAALRDLVAGAGEDDPLAGRRGVTLDADPRLAPGDAIADFPGGSVDARIATALERMRAALRTGERA